VALELAQYLDIHPMAAWNRGTWDERDASVDTRFHQADVMFTPWADYVQVPVGVGLNNFFYTGRELIPSHANHNPIGWYQRYTSGIYVDTRERRLRSRFRYGGKAQWDKADELVTRFGNDTDAFIRAAMNAQLLNNVVEVHEKIARDAVLNNAMYKFLGNGAVWSSANDFGTLDRSGTYKFDIQYLEEMSLRMAIRSKDTLKQHGDYANPVPGQDFRSNVLISVPTSVYWDLWNSPARDWMIDLRQLNDQRIINGGVIQYRNITIQDYGVGMSLWCAGKIDKQVNITSPVNWGDGAPDPETGSVDGIWLTGQGGTAVTHYVQCSDFSDGDFAVGDFVALHASRTSDWGITNGVNFLDGKTIIMEVQAVDTTNNRLVFRYPITEEFNEAVTAGVYGYVTKAQHVYPVYAVGARGMVVWAGREKIVWNRPTDENADFPSIERVTWQERGEMNQQNPDVYEVLFCEGSFANRGAVSIQ